MSSTRNFDMRRYLHRRSHNWTVLALATSATALALLVLAAILFKLVWSGLSAWGPAFFTMNMPPPDRDGGLANAILGSVLMTVAGTAIGTPVGILAGTYLAEYGRGSRFAQFVQFINDILLSAPSIIIGLFIFQVMVVPMGHSSGWAGSVALSILMIPIVVRTTVDMLALVPNGLREAAAALGTPKWKVVTSVCYRAAIQGMLTGIMLAVARISGETAPLLFTALGNDSWTWNMNAPMGNLPLAINKFVNETSEIWNRLAWGGALLVTVAVLALNIAARSIVNIGSVKR
jgi:phosphate transport system permease protein